LPVRRLGRTFYQAKTLELARALLGKRLVRQVRGRRLSGIIVETEAYIGEEDLACHAAAGRTARNEVMYGPPGHAYIYLIYGMHHCLNVVSERRGFPAAVLIRALEPEEGIPIMARRRRLGDRLAAELARRARAGSDLGAPDRDRLLRTAKEKPGAALRALTAGPGRLCQALAIDRRLSGESLAGQHLLLERATAPRAIIATPRIGIDYAGPWRDKPWRFLIADSPWVSTARSRAGPRPRAANASRRRGSP
jgi:DNA-3-methyladenine glycosylase